MSEYIPAHDPWEDNVSDADENAMNHMEAGIANATAVAYNAQATADAALAQQQPFVREDEYEQKGDILAGQSFGVAGRVAVGSGNQTLFPDPASAQGVVWSAFDPSRLTGFPNSSTVFLRGDGAWAAPGGGTSARVFRSTNQTVTGLGVSTAISFDTEVFDNGGMWVIGSPTRLTVPALAGGNYLLGAHAAFAATAAGEMTAFLRLNGATLIASGSNQANGIANVGSVTVQTVYQAVAGDYFEFLVRNDSTVNRNLNTQSAYSPIFYAQRLP